MDEHGSPLEDEDLEVDIEPMPEEEKGVKEQLYDKIHVSVKTLDLIIKLLFLAVAVVIVLGIIAGR